MICNICTKEAGRLIQIREETQGSPTIAVFSRWICLNCLRGMMFPECEDGMEKERKKVDEILGKHYPLKKSVKKKEEKEDVS